MKMSKRKLTRQIAAGLAASALLTVSPVFAEESTFQLDQVTVTASRIEENVATTAKDVSVITKTQLEEKGAKTLADALQGVPGVVVAGQGGPGAKAIPYILGTDRVVVLVDGKRMNLPQGIAIGAGGIDLNTFLIGDNVERIEVVRGGASALYGADAIGGVINIITKKGAGSQTIVSSGFGSDHSYRNSVTTEGSDNGLAWHISGLSDGTDGQRPNSESKNRNIAVRLDKELNQNDALTFTYDLYDAHAGLPGSTAYLTPDDYSDTLRRNWSLGYTSNHDSGQRLFRYYENEYISKGFNWGSNFRNDNKVTAFEYQDSAALNKQHTLTWGGEWRKDEVWSTAEGGTSRKGITTAGYLQDRFAWTDKTTLTTGLRYDHNTIYGDNWLPRVEVSYQKDDTTSLFANWGKIFKAPKFDDLYGDDGYGNLGDPNLKPEEGWTSELGVKKRLNDNSEGTLSVFKRKIDGAIRWQPTGLNWWDPYQPVNIDGYTATGVNASFATKLSDVTTLNLGYTYLDAHDQNEQYTGEPRNTFTVGVTNKSGKLTTVLNGVYVDASGLSSNRVPSRFVANTSFNYAFTKQQSVFLQMNNLFDRKYEEMRGYPANERSVFIGFKQTL
ncbi:MAG: cirA 6 [Anaerosporomusa subterranea]|jgi:outer membrane cobalamin receptor|nr:cirA 6 [Anaerosporomusa subterranea]